MSRAAILFGMLITVGLTTTEASARDTRSRPQPLPIVDAVPPARDIAFPGVITIDVDATDTAHGIFHVREKMPVVRDAGGDGRGMTLLLPEWLPGNHSPTGQIDKLAGLKITAGGKPVSWTRDPVDMLAFHIDPPPGAATIDIDLDYVSPTESKFGRVLMTDTMLRLQWQRMTLYPAGYYVRDIPVETTVTYPTGWTAASALPAKVVGNRYRYARTDYDTLIDSPVLAGQFYRQWQLGPHEYLDTVADTAAQLAATDAQIAAHKALIEQASKLFGAHHYDDYHFLFAISDDLGGIGLEHHRSSEDGVDAGYFTGWDGKAPDRNLLSHEYTHSWNGKFRRGADLWTPDYRTPMRNSLLWVYEGQTQFWGYVLAARSGLLSKQDTLDAIAGIAARLDAAPGRTWRPLADTTNQPIMAYGAAEPWATWQRGTDYYDEGLLIWLEVDGMLRQQSGGTKSIDDFARAFFGINDGDWGEVTYTFDDVVATLNRLAPYDWAGFLHKRIDQTADHAPLGGIAGGGYTLTYSDTPSAYFKAAETDRKYTDLSLSIGLWMGKDGGIVGVLWDGPAFRTGLTTADSIVAVGDLAYTSDRLKEAVTAAKAGTDPIRLTVKRGDKVRTVAIDYHGGLRYPHLEKTGTGEGGLDRLLQAK